MKASVNKRFLIVERDENDAPIVECPYVEYPYPKLKPGEFNSWRKDYRIAFDSEEEAKNALLKVLEINDFDRAAKWLDRQ